MKSIVNALAPRSASLGRSRLRLTTAAGDGELIDVAHTTVTTPDNATVVESYLVQSMGHVWPGPTGEGLFTDHAGPDASTIVWDFAKRHPKSGELADSIN